MRIRLGHLYPDYLNIYADRGNIAVLMRRAELRGHELVVQAIGIGDELDPSAHDLLYIGGGQDREQALIAPDLARKGEALRAAHARGVAMLAVCGGYQLLGRGYRGRDGSFMPGAGLFAHETDAGETRMIGDVLLECEFDSGERQPLAGFENHAGRTMLDPRRRRSVGSSTASATTARPGSKDAVSATRVGTYLHGPLLPRNPWLAGLAPGRALAHAGAGEPPTLAPLDRRAGGRGVSSVSRAGAEARRKALRARFQWGTPSHHPLRA